MWYDGKITEERYQAIRAIVAEKKMRVTCKDFCVYEIELIINETPFSDADRKMARLKYINKLTYEEILDEVDYYSVNTVKNHIKRISLDLRTTCNKLFI